MANIDLEKLLVYLLDAKGSTDNEKMVLKILHAVINHALTAQGLRIKDGCIVAVTPKHRWYMCIRDLYNTMGVKLATEGKVYEADEDDCIFNNDKGGGIENISLEFDGYFRPVTVEEVKQQESSDEMTEFEKELANVIGFGISTAIVSPKEDIEQFAKENAGKLMSIARKQIVDDIDKDYIQKNASMFLQEREQSAFYAGVDSVINAILWRQRLATKTDR